jgi:cytochrome c oxidase subunit 4
MKLSGKEHHVVSPKTYVLILLALLVGTAVTVLAARVDLGPYNIVLAMAIAITKATLVVLFFMHLKYSEGLTKVFAGTSIFWLVVLIAITMVDYFTRF